MIRSPSNSRQRLLDFLEYRESQHLSAPSYLEICEELGFKSNNAAAELVNALVASGHVSRDPRRARSLRLLNKPASGVPMLGSIVAGFPENPSVTQEGRLNLDPTAFGIKDKSDAFALRVRGDSMVGRHFFDGDLVLFDRAAIPKHQDVVAALIDQECTLKTLILKDENAWLKAENPDYPDLIPVHDLQIQGVAKAVIRILAA